MNRYSIQVVWSDEDDCFIATVPEFPGLSAFGDNRAEAFKEAETALCGFIEIHKEKSLRLPEPHKVREFSGQIRIRIPKSLHAELSELAKLEGVSLNTLIVKSLSERGQSERLNEKLNSLEKILVGALFTKPQMPQSSTDALIINERIEALDDWYGKSQ